MSVLKRVLKINMLTPKLCFCHISRVHSFNSSCCGWKLIAVDFVDGVGVSCQKHFSFVFVKDLIGTLNF